MKPKKETSLSKLVDEVLTQIYSDVIVTTDEHESMFNKDTPREDDFGGGQFDYEQLIS